MGQSVVGHSFGFYIYVKGLKREQVYMCEQGVLTVTKTTSYTILKLLIGFML